MLNVKCKAIAVVGLLLILLNSACQQNVAVQARIAAMYREYAREFPEVKSITAKELQSLQQQGKKIILVDVRSPKERAVSTISGALSVAEFERSLEQYRDKETIVVVGLESHSRRISQSGRIDQKSSCVRSPVAAHRR